MDVEVRVDAVCVGAGVIARVGVAGSEVARVMVEGVVFIVVVGGCGMIVGDEVDGRWDGVARRLPLNRLRRRSRSFCICWSRVGIEGGVVVSVVVDEGGIVVGAYAV